MPPRHPVSIVGVATVLLAACVLLAKAAKLDGTWEGKMDYEGQIEALTFEIHAKVDGSKFSFKEYAVWFEGILEGKQRRVTFTVMNGNEIYFTASRKREAE